MYEKSQNLESIVDVRMMDIQLGHLGHLGHLGVPHAPTTDKPSSGAPCEQGSEGVSNPAPIQHVLASTY